MPAATSLRAININRDENGNADTPAAIIMVPRYDDSEHRRRPILGVMVSFLNGHGDILCRKL